MRKSGAESTFFINDFSNSSRITGEFAQAMRRFFASAKTAAQPEITEMLSDFHRPARFEHACPIFSSRFMAYT